MKENLKRIIPPKVRHGIRSAQRKARAPLALSVRNAGRAKNLLRIVANGDFAQAKYKTKLFRNRRKVRAERAAAERAATQENWSEAITHWKRILDRLGGDTPLDVRIALSRAYGNTGDYAAAERVITRSMSLYPLRAKGNAPPSATQFDLESWLALSNELADISVLRRLSDIQKYRSDISSYVRERKRRQSSPKTNKLKIAVFTAISGGYDSFKPPEKLDPRLDYIIYTDTPVKNVGIYDVRPILFVDSDKTRSARFVKTNPHNLLNNYDIAVWVDANLMILGDVYPFIEDVLRSGKSVGAIKHPIRKSVFEEINECLAINKDDRDVLLELQRKYKNEGYDCDDLIESNVFVYDLRDTAVHAFLNDWWNMIDKYSRRDQLSVNYCLDKHGVRWHPLTDRPNTARNHPAFALTKHGTQENNLIERLIDELQPTEVDPFKAKPYAEHKEARIAKQRDRTIDVIVCVHNALEEVKKCLDSIVQHRNGKSQKLIIVDDGSDTPTSQYLKSFQKKHTAWTTLLRNEQAGGYTKAANKGLKASGGEFAILLNSDTIATNYWAEKMADAAFSNHSIGIVGPMSSAASHQSIPDHRNASQQTAINGLPKGLTPQDMNSYCEQWASADLIPRVPLVHGFCFGIKRVVIDAIGYFDEVNFPRGYGEENDYCFRAADAGFGLVVATHTYIFHAKSKSYKSPERVKLMEAGGAALRKKHGQRRIARALATMQENPLLQRMRDAANALYNDRG